MREPAPPYDGRRATRAVARERRPPRSSASSRMSAQPQRAASRASGPSTRATCRSTGSRASARAARSGRPTRPRPATLRSSAESTRVHLVEAGWLEPNAHSPRRRLPPAGGDVRARPRGRRLLAQPRAVSPVEIASSSATSSRSTLTAGHRASRRRRTSCPIWDRVVASTLEYSGIRLHNARSAESRLGERTLLRHARTSREAARRRARPSEARRVRRRRSRDEPPSSSATLRHGLSIGRLTEPEDCCPARLDERQAELGGDRRLGERFRERDTERVERPAPRRVPTRRRRSSSSRVAALEEVALAPLGLEEGERALGQARRPAGFRASHRPSRRRRPLRPARRRRGRLGARRRGATRRASARIGQIPVTPGVASDVLEPALEETRPSCQSASERAGRRRRSGSARSPRSPSRPPGSSFSASWTILRSTGVIGSSSTRRPVAVDALRRSARERLRASPFGGLDSRQRRRSTSW